jgi:hypothetical protein
MKKTLAIALITALGSLTACAVDSGESIRTTEAALTGTSCNANSGINPMKAALAVAMASEIGRLDPLKDLQITNNKVVLTNAAKAECLARGFGSCPNVASILGMQESSVNTYINQGVFNAVSFREDIKASFDRQKSHEQNLASNYSWLLPQWHQLFEIGVSDYGACGIHYDFSVNGNKVENLKSRMMFFGGTENPFIDFRSTSKTISIDPTGTMNGDTNTSSGVCSVGCYGYGRQLRSTCCTCNGAQGTYLRAPWDANMVYCAY